MKLKTYTAQTMAQALAQVRKDLGPDAMILHTRSYRAGAWFGIGGKNMVEITASSAGLNAPSKKKLRPMPRVAQQQLQQQQQAQPTAPTPQRAHQAPSTGHQTERQPEIVIQRGATVTRQRLTRQESPVVSAMTSAASSSAQSTPNQSPPSAQPRPEQAPSDDFIPDSPPEIHTRSGGRLEGRDALFSQDFGDQRSAQSSKKPKARVIQRPETLKRPSASIEVKPVPTPSEQRTSSVAKRDAQPKQQQPSDQPIVASSTTGGEQSPEQLKAQLDTLSKMMGQVLESTRKTAVAVGTGQTGDALPNGEMPGPLFTLYAQMLDNDVPVELADRLVGSIRDRFDALELKDPLIVRQALLRAIESTIKTRSESLLMHDREPTTGRPRVIALVGPTGVGKTTTVAKLAATYKLRHGKKVGLITSDTYRIAA
ncbi:MAG: hypothetical protein ACWA5W_07600, partial [Phycisphaerales bacterium]